MNNNMKQLITVFMSSQSCIIILVYEWVSHSYAALDVLENMQICGCDAQGGRQTTTSGVPILLW